MSVFVFLCACVCVCVPRVSYSNRIIYTYNMCTYNTHTHMYRDAHTHGSMLGCILYYPATPNRWVRGQVRAWVGVDIVTPQQEAPTTCDVDDDALGGGTRLEWNDGCETTTTTQRTRAHATHVQDDDDDDDDAGGSVSTR